MILAELLPVLLELLDILLQLSSVVRGQVSLDVLQIGLELLMGVILLTIPVWGPNSAEFAETVNPTIPKTASRTLVLTTAMPR